MSGYTKYSSASYCLTVGICVNRVTVIKENHIFSLFKFVSERKAEEQRLDGGGQLHPGAG